jgi:hypothetical protein
MENKAGQNIFGLVGLDDIIGGPGGDALSDIFNDVVGGSDKDFRFLGKIMGLGFHPSQKSWRVAFGEHQIANDKVRLPIPNFFFGGFAFGDLFDPKAPLP